MRRTLFTVYLCAVAVPLLVTAACAQSGATDVPPAHWAAASVKTVITHGVMDAPGGRFNGGAKVTRIELANTLARFARALEKGGWNGTAASPAGKKQPAASSWEGSAVTRYELAALLDRAGRNVAQGLPKPAGKTFGASEALPAIPADKLPKSGPARDSLAYLAKNRMIWPNSPLLTPSAATVTGREVVTAFTAVIAGLNDRLTDEPQNREDLGAPPSHRRGK